MDDVQSAYQRWHAGNPTWGPEQWLKELFEPFTRDVVNEARRPEPEGLAFDTVQYILRRLCQPKNATKGPYYHGITRPINVHSDHADFWRLLRRGDSLSVVTFNYDILAEHGLVDVVGETARPAFYYGGFTYRQHVQRMIGLASERRSESFALGLEVPLYKLHGSVNWAWEPHSETIKIHDDVRAAFRSERSGIPAIVPPIEEKQLPREFTTIWTAAERDLSKSERWIVCGYSAPAYDLAARALLARSAAAGPPKRVELIDPRASELVEVWSLPGVDEVRPHASLRQAVLDLELEGLAERQPPRKCHSADVDNCKSCAA
jgi:hypothetical protein